MEQKQIKTMATKKKTETTTPTIAPTRTRETSPKVQAARDEYKSECAAAKEKYKAALKKIKTDKRLEKLLGDPAQLQLLKVAIAERETVNAESAS